MLPLLILSKYTRALAPIAGVGRYLARTIARTPASQRMPMRPGAPKAAPLRLTLAEQWARLAGVLNAAISGTGEARQLHAAAAQQLDLAQYALSMMMDELSAVMMIPGRRERASVHVLDMSPARARAQSMAA